MSARNVRMEAGISLGILVVGLGAGCASSPDERSESLATSSMALQGDDDSEGDDSDDGNPARREAKRLFEAETFGGNGRTCRTCHSVGSGTLSIAQIGQLFAEDPAGPLFRADGTDDGQGNGTSRIRTDGTIRVRIPLPPNAKLADDPTATSVTLSHGIPSTINTPALDPVLMYDGRAPNLVEQARGAVHDHTGHTIEPTEQQLQLIADFQKTKRFFSSKTLREFAAGEKAPTLPEGNTASERRGRRFFDDVPVVPPSTRGMCAICHSGPMLNEVNEHNPIPVPPFRVPKGTRFQSILSGELLPGTDPFRAYAFTHPDGTAEVAVTSDPGRALQTGDFRGFPFGNLGQFKIPSLWNVRNTAPYFHNNAAKTLETVLDHYATFFVIATPAAIPGAPPIVMTDQDKADAIAFLQLL